MLNTFRIFFSHLSYPQKFSLISILFVLPLIAFFPIILELNTRIDQYGNKERNGILYVRPLENLLEDVQAHQLTLEKFINGQVGSEGLANAQARVDEDLQALQSAHEKYATELRFSNEPDNLNIQWQVLKTNGKTISAHDSFVKHSLLIKAIRGLISLAGDRSFLILDPDLDTSYMVDAILLKLPTIQSELTEASILGEEAVSSPTTFSTADRTQMIILIGQLRSNLDEMEQNVLVSLSSNAVGKSMNAPGQMVPLVKKPLETNIVAVNDFLSFIDTRIINAETISISPSDFTQRSNSALAANAALYDAASQAMEVGVKARIERQTNQLIISLSTAVVSIILAFIVGFFLMLAISRPLSVLNQAAQRLAAGDLSTHIPVTSEDEIGQVSAAFSTMAEKLKQTLEGLEQRSLDLSRRSIQLEAAALVTRSAAEIRGQKELLETIVHQISERFGFYHAGIFLTDINGEYILLEAASSAGGKKMIQRGHKLAIDPQGIVSFAAYQKRPRIAQDVGADTILFNNPDLPETHSEMALPLLVRNRLIGILDIQSEEHNAFSSEDISTLQIMTDQIALAIENARLLNESQAAIDELQAITTENITGTWRERLGQLRKGYSYSSAGISAISPTDEDVANNASNIDGYVIKIPVALRGQRIGQLSLIRKSNESPWTEAEQEMADKISIQVALAVENARLLEESQRRALREQTVNDLSSRFSRSLNVDTLLQNAVRELHRIPQVSEVSVYIAPKETIENQDDNTGIK